MGAGNRAPKPADLSGKALLTRPGVRGSAKPRTFLVRRQEIRPIEIVSPAIPDHENEA